jgi:hypothetical protein
MRKSDNVTTFMCRLFWNLPASTSWNLWGVSSLYTGIALNFTLPFFLLFHMFTYTSHQDLTLLTTLIRHGKPENFLN